MSHFRGNSHFPLMWKKKRHQESYLSLPQKHFLSPNSKDIPSVFPPLHKTILLPTVTSLLPALSLSPQKPWQAGGTRIQEATAATFSSTKTWSLAGTQHHPRAQLQGMLISAPGQQGSSPCTETVLVFIPLPPHERPQPWDAGHGIQSNSSSRKVGTHLSFCLALNRWLMCTTLPQGTEVENKLPSSTRYVIKKKKSKYCNKIVMTIISNLTNTWDQFEKITKDTHRKKNPDIAEVL